MPYTEEFLQAFDHPQDCKCPLCLQYWAEMGPEDCDDDTYGPFTKEEVVEKQKELGIFEEPESPSA